MSTRESFGQACQRVSEEQGWEVLPSGVRVDLPGGRRQVVSLEFFEFESQELVRLYTVTRAWLTAPWPCATAS
jgi:hypothetical protein